MYEVDFRTFDRLFKSKDGAIAAIERSLKKDECIKIIFDNGNLIGVLIFYTYYKRLKTSLKSFRLLIVDILDYFVLCDIKNGDFYIAEIVVDKDYRSKGYGKKIITDVLNYAKDNCYGRVTLDVDFRNVKAKSLYERLGFEVFNKKSFLKRGMYNMEFRLS